LRIFELETFLSMTERADTLQRKSNKYIYNQSQLEIYGKTEIDVCDEHNVPDSNNNKINKDIVTVSLQSKIKKINNNQSKMQKMTKKAKLRKVIREMSDIMKDPHPFWDIFVDDKDILFWKLILCGPATTPYEGGVFLLYMDFSKDFPEKAPKMRFITPIKHVNVNSYGRICHSIFDRNYNPDIKIRDILNNVYGLLLDPDWDDPLDSVLRQEYADDQQLFRLSVIKHVQKHAMNKTREQYQKELSGEGKDQISINHDTDNNNGGGWIPQNRDNQEEDDKIV